MAIRPVHLKPAVRRIQLEDVLMAAVAHTAITEEGHKPSKDEASVRAAHEFLAATFAQCTPKTPVTALPKPKFISVRSPRAAI